MEITEEILNTLVELKNSKSKKERIHAHALLLLDKGKSIQEVAEIFDVTQRSVYIWIKKFKDEGITSLSRKPGAGRKAILNESHKETIREEIGRYPHQPKKAYAITLERLPVKMSYKTYTRFLKKYSI